MTRKQDEQPIDYNVATVSITTCGDLYNEWRTKKRLYKSVNANGLTIDVEYADTLHQIDGNGHEIDELAPVVVCLHGAPGSHRDYSHFIKYFSQMGKRVIVPNFPTYDITTKTRVFRHSAREKKEYIKDFLKAIGINRIDLLVSHSSAIYPTALLWSDQNAPYINSIAFINPSGHRRIKAMRPKMLTSVFVRVYQKQLGRAFMRLLGTTVLSITGCPVRPDNMDNVILSATTMVYSKFRYLSETLSMMRDKQVPVMLVLSENDKLVDTDISYELAEILGAREENFSTYNQYSVLEKERQTDSFPWIVVLPHGGHYSFKNHPKLVNESIGNFMDGVMNTTSSTRKIARQHSQVEIVLSEREQEHNAINA